ncbi:hypothetical protein GGS21DRAFT_59558 [Xylaria nigripes]|nr:hypothetical protein GGS21DRAFT_59558 [Xylaria nigripes]
MRRHLIALALSFTMISVRATGLRSRTGDKNGGKLPWFNPDIASCIADMKSNVFPHGFTCLNGIISHHGHGDEGDEGDPDDHGEGPPISFPESRHEPSYQSTSTSSDSFILSPQPTSSKSSTSLSTSLSTTTSESTPLPILNADTAFIVPTSYASSSSSSSLPITTQPQPISGTKTSMLSVPSCDYSSPAKDGDNTVSETRHKQQLAGGLAGGLVAMLLLLLAWYWFVFRRKRRERHRRWTFPVLSKEIDVESCNTVNQRSGIHTPHNDPRDGRSSTDRQDLPPATPYPGRLVMDNLTSNGSASFSSSFVHATSHPAVQRPSPIASQASFADGYAASRPAFHIVHPQSHNPQQSPQGPIAVGHRPLSQPSPLQTSTSHLVPNQTHATMEHDEEQPPRYPDIIHPSSKSLSSVSTDPTSPVTVSPLSVISSHVYPPNEPLAPPQIMSPICQLGQTFASSLEYDESAEAVTHSSCALTQRDHDDEKQDLSSQQTIMPRY